MATFNAFPRSLRQTLTGDINTGNPKPIEVPPWQRSYSWRTTEVDQFWNDIVAFSEDCPHGSAFGSPQYFIGSIVIVTREDRDAHLLLDGQQRLVTASLLLAAIRDYILRQADAADEASRELARELQSTFIIAKEVFTEHEVNRITLNTYDQPYFRDFVQNPQSGTADFGITPELESHRLLQRGYQTLDRNLRRHLGEHPPTDTTSIRWAYWLAGVLTMNLMVIVATSDDEDTAAEIFETLNDRGIGLSTPDLLRNLILRRSLEKYRDEIIARWREILRIEDVARTDLFLRHFWISREGDVKKHSLYREMRNHVNSHKALTYPLDFTKQLSSSADVYQAIANAQDEDDEVARLLQNIALLDAFSLRPALLSAWEHGTTNQKRRLLRALISLFVRHRVIAGLENNEFEHTVFTLAKRLRESGDFDAALTMLRASPPADKEFEAAFRLRTITRQDTARYLLMEFERARHPNQELAVEPATKVHVEHIYPQRPPAEWCADDHAKIVNRIGNLTLLGKALNQGLANARFSEKRDNDVRGYRVSDLKITQALAMPPYDKTDLWTIKEIEDRQEALAAEARSIWKL